jgi:leucyl aminopeptidase
VSTSISSALIPKITVLKESEFKPENFEALAIPVLAGEKVEVPASKAIKKLEKELELSFSEILNNWPDASGKAGELFEFPISIGKIKRIYFVGIGTDNSDDLRKAGIALARKVKNSGVGILSTLVSNPETATNHVIAITLASYSWLEKKATKADKKPKAASFTLIGSFSEEVNFGNIVAHGVWQARDLIHTPANIKNPLWLANRAKLLVAEAKNSALSINIKSGSQLKEFGGLLAVGNSAPKPGPRLIEVSYAPKGSSKWPHVVVVGKGITFDTGGVSLKRPYDFMIGMKSDMAGAAAALTSVLNFAALSKISKKASKVRVTALLMCAENSLSASAQRPSDVIKHYGGTTVEVINTDAEGRLVLADGLAYADAKLDPDYLVDIATLTGAATLALGRQYSAMYSRNDKLASELAKAGEEIGERVWRMPLVDDYKIALESTVADFNHTAEKPDFNGGSVTAALFLEHFAGKRNWVHLDIAGPARSESDSGENPKGGTGYGVRVLTKWLTSFSA